VAAVTTEGRGDHGGRPPELARARNRRRWSGPSAPTALVVDPDGAGAAPLRTQFSRPGVDLVVCHDGAEALIQVGRLTPGLVLIRPADTRLPAADVVRIIRAHLRVPVVVAVGEGETDLVRPVFAAGASGVVAYPYNCAEITSLIAQYFPDAEMHRAEQATLVVGQVALNGPAFEVTVQGAAVGLPLGEFELLRYLMLHAGQVVSEEQILGAVWTARGGTASAKTIALHVRRLRERLGDAVELVRIRGVGYRLRPPAAAQQS
jgi:DNA-binding response OmpR family regulator